MLRENVTCPPHYYTLLSFYWSHYYFDKKLSCCSYVWFRKQRWYHLTTYEMVQVLERRGRVFGLALSLQVKMCCLKSPCQLMCQRSPICMWGQQAASYSKGWISSAELWMIRDGPRLCTQQDGCWSIKSTPLKRHLLCGDVLSVCWEESICTCSHWQCRPGLEEQSQPWTWRTLHCVCLLSCSETQQQPTSIQWLRSSPNLKTQKK